MSQIISFLEHLDMSEYDPAIQYDYENVYMAFLKKRQSIELREAYAQIIFTADENARFDARMRYLKNKRDIDDFPKTTDGSGTADTPNTARLSSKEITPTSQPSLIT